MATNLALDDDLIEEARKAGGHKTKKDAVTAAIKEYIQRRKQRKITAEFGTIDFDPEFNHKAVAVGRHHDGLGRYVSVVCRVLTPAKRQASQEA